MSGGSAATAARHKLENDARTNTLKLLSVCAASKRPRTISTAECHFDSAFTGFLAKLPSNHGAQMCLEELWSFIRRLAEQSKPKDEALEAAADFCENPPFTEALAAFGHLPKHPYILVFHPNAYQTVSDGNKCRKPLMEDASITLPTPHKEKDNTKDMMKDAIPDHIKELDTQEKVLEEIFNEEHQPTGVQCPNCHETKYLNLRNQQKRAADEGSAQMYHCLRCGDIGRLG